MEVSDTIAAQYFHGKESFNCCQAVLKAYSAQTNMTDNYIEDNFRKHGGGRAPEGMCGALYASVVLLEDQPETLESVVNEFTKNSGALDCRTIRKSGKLPCRDCVELVGKLLSDKQLTNKI